MTPSDRRYTKDHEWILVEGNIARIGITQYAEEQLGDIVYVELPAVGDEFNAGDSFAVVESVKAASEIYTVVAGKVVEVNSALEAQPERINLVPYDAFIVAIEVASVDEDALMSAEAYDAFIAAEA